MGCNVCGGWQSAGSTWIHDCMVPECPVQCVLGFVWKLQPDGKWYAVSGLIQPRRLRDVAV